MNHNTNRQLNNIIYEDSDGNLTEDGNWANYVEMLNDEVIEYDKDSYYCECEEKYLDWICPCVRRG